MKVSKMWKAIVSGAAAGAAAAATAVQDGQVTTVEGVTIALAVLGALGVTWAVPNRQAVTPPRDL
ncbi:hypothetical protein ABT167_27335 [Streptomyces sp. NPDC001792]|uniref:hypothetical protein n=1 Tax=Streptomyces sp. NPDC001792 TaxID=3154524 RepID=UPI003332E9BD